VQPASSRKKKREKGGNRILGKTSLSSGDRRSVREREETLDVIIDVKRGKGGAGGGGATVVEGGMMLTTLLHNQQQRERKREKLSEQLFGTEEKRS